MKKSTLFIALLAFAVGIFAAQQFASKEPATLTLTPDNGAGNTVVPMEDGKFGGDFTLQNSAGESVKLSDFRGKTAVMYFGYASCPDVCPTTLSIISSALKELSPEEAAQIQPIFISVDPERDQGEKLQSYAKHFFPSFIGLTGGEEELRKVAGQYGAFFNKTDSDSALGYLVDHTSKTYLISKDSKYVNILPHDMTKEMLLENLRSAP